MRRAPARLVVCAALVAAGCGATPGADRRDAAVDAARAPDDAGAGDAAVPGFAVQYSDPDHGPFRGGTFATVRGAGFRADDEVWIGGRRVVSQRWIDSRRIELETPPGEPGAATVEVRRAGGGDVASRAGAFSYDAIAVDPPGGSVAGGTFVTVTGYGTDFGAAPVVRFDGVPLTGVTVQHGQRLTGFAPPGVGGDADVDVAAATGAWHADRAYTYLTTGDPFSGGFSGPPIHGALNVVVMNAWTKDGIPDAFVAIGDPSTTAYRGRTDALGQITFSGPDLRGPVVVTAWAADHEVGTFHCVDAENLSIWLRSPVPPPTTGPPGVGQDGARIRGHIVWGEAVALGSPYWNLVPEPRTATERKRVYVTSAASGLTGQPSAPVAPIDYTGPDRLAWPFEVSARSGALAVVAVAGLYDPARDPSGQGVQGFEPFALGVARGVLVGPGEDRGGVDIVINIPLDAALRVLLDRPPPLHTPGWPGPTVYRLRGGVDLGGEGVAHLGGHGLPYDRGFYPGEHELPDSATAITLTGVPALARAVADGSYAFQIGAFAPGGGAPFSVRIVRGVRATSTPVVVGDFLGVPRAIDPPPDGIGSARQVRFAPEGETTGTPTFHLHMLSDASGNPVWRGITCGGEHALDLPDLSSIGLVWPPPGAPLSWTIYSITGPGPYRDFSYRWLNFSYWRGYAAATYGVQFP